VELQGVKGGTARGGGGDPEVQVVKGWVGVGMEGDGVGEKDSGGEEEG